MILIRQILCATLIFLLYACSGGGSVDYMSAKTAARIENDLKGAEEWGLKALITEPNNAHIPYFLATEVYTPMKKYNQVAEMYVEALSRTEGLILDSRSTFQNSDQEYINNVHEAIKLKGYEEYNEGVELLRKNKKNKAISKFELTIKLVPGFTQPFISLSKITISDENYDKALVYIENGLKTIKEQVEASNNNIELPGNSILKKIKNDANELNTLKAMCLTQLGKSDEAIVLLNSINSDNQLIQINIEKQIFNITLNQEDYEGAIILGNTLVEKMFISLGIEESDIAITCYNLAFCNYQFGNKKHTEALEILKSDPDNKEKSKGISLAKDAIKYYEEAKGRYYDSSAYNPDDTKSSKQAKEINKSIKQLKEIIIPGLQK